MHITARFSRYLLRFTANRRTPRQSRHAMQSFIELDESPTVRLRRRTPPIWAAPASPPQPTATGPTFGEAWLAHSAGLAVAAQGISSSPTPASLAKCLEQGGHLLSLLASRSTEYRHDIDNLAVHLFTVAARAREYRTLNDARQDLKRLALQFSRLFRSLVVSAAHSLANADDPTANDPTAEIPVSPTHSN